MPWDRKRYPKEWGEIRTQIMARAGGKCERCGVPHHAVGYREADGSFVPVGGNADCDAAGWGQLPFKEAKEMVKHFNEWCEGWDGHKLLVIVLTTAHVDPATKHDKTDCRPEVLQMLCQRCHLLEDLDDHKRNAATTRAKKKAGLGQMELIQ